MSEMLSLWRGVVHVAVRRDRATMHELLAYVAALRGFSVDDLKGPRTFKPLAHARQEAMWLMRQQWRPDDLEHYTYPIIGRFLNRHHTTVISGVLAHEDRLNGKQNRRRGSGSRHSTPPDQRPTTGGARSVTTERLQDCGEGGKAS